MEGGYTGPKYSHMIQLFGIMAGIIIGRSTTVVLPAGDSAGRWWQTLVPGALIGGDN